MNTAILIFQSKDQTGIVAHISGFLFEHGANIISADQYSTDFENGFFFMRIEFCWNQNQVTMETLQENFDKIATKLNAKWRMIDNTSTRLKIGIMASQTDHCLAELLYRWRSGELKIDIPFVIVNHDVHKDLVSSYNIPYFYLPANSQDRQESTLLEMVKNTDCLVLARYMQILSDTFISQYGKDIINIHHSFLPSFKGANPYLQAYERGVKVIGATAHFVTHELDEGPIIEQTVEPVSHKDSVQDLINKGKHLEKLALARAVQLYCEYRIIRFQNKTVIFS